MPGPEAGPDTPTPLIILWSMATEYDGVESVPAGPEAGPAECEPRLAEVGPVAGPAVDESNNLVSPWTDAFPDGRTTGSKGTIALSQPRSTSMFSGGLPGGVESMGFFLLLPSDGVGNSEETGAQRANSAVVANALEPALF